MKAFKSIFAAILLTVATWAQALEIAPYTEGAFDAAKRSGQAVALHFHADWCPTCRAQAAVLDELKSDASLPIKVLVVNYDNERALRRELKVRTQSTFVVYRGAVERARMAGETSKEAIKSVLKAGL